MNYIFVFLLSISYIILQITYQKIIKNNNIINIKKYLEDSIILSISYFILINILKTLKLDDYLILWDIKNNKKDSSISNISLKTLSDKITSPMIFTNDPNF